MADGDIKALEGQINSLKAEVALRSESAEKLCNTKNESMDKRLSSHIKLFNIVYIAIAGVIAIITIFLTIFSVSYIKRKANLYAEIAAQEAVKTVFDDYKKDLDVKIETMENRIEFNYWYKVGEKEFESKDYSNAVKSFTKAIEKKPNHVYAVGVRGIAYTRLGNHKEAIKDLDKAIDIKKDYAQAFYSKGISHFFLEEYVEAFKAFNTTVDLFIKQANYDYASQSILTMTSALNSAERYRRFNDEKIKLIRGDIEQLEKQLEDAKEKEKEIIK